MRIPLHVPSFQICLCSTIAIAIAISSFNPCSATTVSIDWVEQLTSPPSSSPFYATTEDLPVIFPSFSDLYADTTWRSYMTFSTRASNEKETFKHVKYTPGTVFKHRLFGYRAVIMGVTPSCEASEQWIQQMRVDDLPGGRKQPFYWSMVDVRDRPVQTTYVAQSNIMPISTQVLHPDVSSVFRKYDSDVGRYVPLDRSVEDVASEVQPHPPPPRPCSRTHHIFPFPAPRLCLRTRCRLVGWVARRATSSSCRKLTQWTTLGSGTRPL